MLMPPLTYIYASEAARTTAGGRGVGGGRITPPTACKWLRIDENGAWVAGVHKARLCPATGRRRASSWPFRAFTCRGGGGGCG